MEGANGPLRRINAICRVEVQEGGEHDTFALRGERGGLRLAGRLGSAAFEGRAVATRGPSWRRGGCLLFPHRYMVASLLLRVCTAAHMPELSLAHSVSQQQSLSPPKALNARKSFSTWAMHSDAQLTRPTAGMTITTATKIGVLSIDGPPDQGSAQAFNPQTKRAG